MIYNPKVTKTKFKNPKKIPRTRVTCMCGCGKNRFDLYIEKRFSEIGGVVASNEFWKDFFNKLFQSTEPAE